MMNHFCSAPLWKCSATLAAVAQGNKPAETVIRNGRLINVCTGEIIPDIGVAIACGRIAMVGDINHCIGEGTAVIDAHGQYISPGFMDGHIHVESSMMSVAEYARAVIPHGTVSIYMDPHEICNVLGLDGVRCMIDDSKRTELKTMVTTPSCVPAVPGFEDTGSVLGPAEIGETMKWDNVVGLGEMMNFPGVLASSEQTHEEIAQTLKADKIVTGHYSMPETGRGLNAYIASGIRCCHESTRMEDALEKMRLGMYAMFREGSAWRDLHEVAKSITQHKIDTRFAVLVSDDTHPYTLLSKGHMDHIVRRAVEEGIDVVTAIQMVTINCAQCFRMDQDLGSITPGKCADIVFINDLDQLNVTRVLINGKTVAEDGRYTQPLKPYQYPEWATKSMHIRDAVTPNSFRIRAEGEEVTARVIEVIAARVGSFERHIKLKVNDGLVQSDTQQDVLKTAVFERHHATGKVGFGFVKGFGIKCGAMASTVAHDAHNLLVIGTNDEDMALAANTLVSCGGGMTAVQNGKVLGKVPLPIAGLMNDKPVEEIGAAVENLNAAWKQIGCDMVSPYMTMALISLACLPELRLTDRGLVDCTKFQFVHLFLPQSD